MNKYGIIMAGGGGTRFWPLSRKKLPKQLLNLSGNGLMINETIERISNFIERENIIIVTTEEQVDKVRELVEDGITNILVEPSARNTAACIGYAAMKIIKKHGDGVMCIFPSDHHIKDEEEFTRVLNLAVEEAVKENKLVTIGITPTFPSTGYGYINFNTEDKGIIKKVEAFVEKPNYETAQKYTRSKEYLWNSGMFVWKASVILENFQRFLPKVSNLLTKIGNSMNTQQEKKILYELYPKIQNISIDYGIIERSDDVVVVEGDFGWSDLGSWDTLGAMYEMDQNGNIITGEQINLETYNCISYSDKRLVATIGINDIIIVETEDVVLVCAKDKAQDVKKIVAQLEKDRKMQYL